MMRRIVAYGLLLFIAAFSPAAQRQERLIDTWRPTHYDIDITFDQKLTSVRAKVKIDALVLKAGTSTIDLDFGSMPVSGVEVNGRSAQFKQHDQQLDVLLGASTGPNSTVSITVTYSGTPSDGLAFKPDKDGNPTAVGDNWPDRVHAWIPSFDHPSAKASVTWHVTAASNYSAVANGTPVGEPTTSGGETTWAFNEPKPVSPYNMVVAVGNFATGTLTPPAAVPISYYVPRSSGQLAELGFSPAAPSLETFSKLVGPYPYRKLALIVGSTPFGGMENANTIVLTPGYFDNFQSATRKSPVYQIPTNREEVLAHEIAHQWFGDSVTESTWADLWLSEGFATYFAGLFLERVESTERFREYMQGKATSYFAYEKTHRTPIHDTATLDLMQLLNANNYEKGGWVLHMLRRELGDKTFFKALRAYYSKYHESMASTDDLRRSFEKVAGRDLRWFFDRWVFKAGHPIYHATWKNAERGRVAVTLTQTQIDEPFLDPVTLRLETANGSRDIVLRPKDKSTTVTIKGSSPQRITVDPMGDLLKEIN